MSSSRAKEIIVTKAGHGLHAPLPQTHQPALLILTRSWEKPIVTSPEIGEFRAYAFQAAIKKERELGLREAVLERLHAQSSYLG